MGKRYAAVWFRHLKTDWTVHRRPELKGVPFVLVASERGRKIIKAASSTAEIKGVETGMALADSQAILPELQVLDDDPALANRLLHALGEWYIRYTPTVIADPPDGLFLDTSGCTHLWGGEQSYLEDIVSRMSSWGYDVRMAIADTAGAAWALSRYGRDAAIILPGEHVQALHPLPPAALRLAPETTARLLKLGFHRIESFINMPRPALRRRFGQEFLLRLDHALGLQPEPLEPLVTVVQYQERLPTAEPICTATGIEIALDLLLDKLCRRFTQEQKGLRTAVFKAYRGDGTLQQVQIGTTQASRSKEHLTGLFRLKTPLLSPELGFELFLLEAPVVEDLSAKQEALWQNSSRKDENALAELLDRLAGKLGTETVHRYLPDEHYWPERSVKTAASLQEQPNTDWRTDRRRPVLLLPKPETIDVMVPLPDYPPVQFRHRNRWHQVQKADGPERLEPEWWLETGPYRDYYCVEDEEGARYWLFRLGSYTTGNPTWFMHGFFA
jgi:protein ImuB